MSGFRLTKKLMNCHAMVWRGWSKVFVLLGAAATIALLTGCGGGGGKKGPSPGVGTGIVTGRVENLKEVDSPVTVTVQGTELEAVVQPDGSFRLAGVPIGERTVSFATRTGRFGAHVSVQVGKGQETVIPPIRLGPTGLIAGIVVGNFGNDPAVTRPVLGALVTATPLRTPQETMQALANGRIGLVTRTNLRGEYMLRAVPPGQYLLSVEHRLFQRAERVVEVAAFQTVAADFELQSIIVGTGTVKGTVMARKGEELVPVAGAFVVLVPQKPDVVGVPPLPDTPVQELVKLPLPRLFDFTDDNGQYEINNVPVGDYLVVVYARDFPPASQKVGVEANQVVEVNFVLELLIAQVHGVVTNAQTGEPLAKALVMAFSSIMVLRNHTLNAVDLAQRPERVATTYTDENGRYQLSLPPGFYILRATKEGFEPAQQSIKLAANQTIEVNFALQPALPPIPTGVTVTLGVGKKIYQPGEVIKMTIILANKANEKVTLVFPTSQIYDVVVLSGGVEVWRWSHGKFFLQVITVLELNPGEEKRYEVEWNQTDNNGNPVETGVYTAYAVITTMRPFRSEEVEIVIGGAQ